MNIQDFINRHPYLYHLTDRNNFPGIIDRGLLLSTSSIARMSGIDELQEFLRNKRPEHTVLTVDGIEYRIRDQRPISEVVLARSLTHNWTNGDFIEHLNKRVFMWPNLNRLKRHYDRYVDEKPIIIRFRTSDILELHPEAEFCRLNSGATRCSSHWGGNAPERGPETFLTAPNYELPASSVAEVTFIDSANLPKSFWTSDKPNGPWTEVGLNL